MVKRSVCVWGEGAGWVWGCVCVSESQRLGKRIWSRFCLCFSFSDSNIEHLSILDCLFITNSQCLLQSQEKNNSVIFKIHLSILIFDIVSVIFFSYPELQTSSTRFAPSNLMAPIYFHFHVKMNWKN